MEVFLEYSERDMKTSNNVDRRFQKKKKKLFALAAIRPARRNWMIALITYYLYHGEKNNRLSSGSTSGR